MIREGDSNSVDRVDRLKAALSTFRMGEWSWDMFSGAVTWDANVALLFGLDEGEFGGTYDDWIELIDERDRARVKDAVNASVARREPFRFDHRCMWPDGTVHWIEGIGEFIVDENDTVIGAFGLAVDIDERHREVEERTRLLEIERRHRERVEYLAKVHDVLARSVDLAEIVESVTQSVIPDLAEWCSIVVAIDRRRDRPSITVAHRDPSKVRWAEQIQRDYPYDPDAPWGAARVIRTGQREVIATVDPVVFSLPGGDILAEAGLRSVVTVPLAGALGILGAMQLIRCDDQPPFGPAEVDLIDELAGRVGAAMNIAILFDRQARSRAALDTLQQVSGRIAAVATTTEIVHCVVTYGASGIRADGSALFLAEEDGTLRLKEGSDDEDSAAGRALLCAATQAMDETGVVVRRWSELIERSLDESDGTTVGVPLRILNRVVGSLAFTFDEHRDLTPEELSMLVTLGSRCAGALERASLYERERAIALTFQHRLLSTLPPTPDWIDAAASYRPATSLAIGGDWYQILDAGAGRIAAVVGDAVGHGLNAAAAMGQLRASLATAVAIDAEPDNAIAAVDLFAQRGADTLGASLAYILFEEDRPARYASAGHMPVVWVPADGPPVLLEGGRGPLLGFRVPSEGGETADVPFGSGDLLVMYTDGLIERRDETIDDALRRLLRAVEETRHLPTQTMCDSLIERLTVGHDPDDDIALLVIKRR